MKEPIEIENEELRVRAIELAQAFPSVLGDMGLTKREYFAGLALLKIRPPTKAWSEELTRRNYDNWASECILMADRLLEELEK